MTRRLYPISAVDDGRCSCPKCKPAQPLLPCPFCGSADIDPEGWASTRASGPACNACSGTAQTIELWNTRPQIFTDLPPLGDSRARRAQEREPLCNHGWELE